MSVGAVASGLKSASEVLSWGNRLTVQAEDDSRRCVPLLGATDPGMAL